MSARNARHAAKVAGESQYFSGTPCVNGHLCPRQTANGSCVVCRRQRNTERKQRNPEHTAALLVNWKRAHPEKVKAHKHTDYLRHTDRINRHTKQWRADNPGKLNATTARRRAQLLRATPPWANFEIIRGLYVLGRKLGQEVDHVVPLRSKLVCGLHCEANLQLLPLRANRSKGNRSWPGMP